MSQGLAVPSSRLCTPDTGDSGDSHWPVDAISRSRFSGSSSLHFLESSSTFQTKQSGHSSTLERHSFNDGFHYKISAVNVAAFQGGQGSLLESLSRKAAALHVSRAVLCYVMSSMRTYPNDSTPLCSLKSQLCCALNHSAARKSQIFWI